MQFYLDFFVTEKYTGSRVKEVPDLAKMGRPKTDEPRRNQVMVRFTDKEYRKLKECAEKNNLTVTETVRKGVGQMMDSKPSGRMN